MEVNDTIGLIVGICCMIAIVCICGYLEYKNNKRLIDYRKQTYDLEERKTKALEKIAEEIKNDVL